MNTLQPHRGAPSIRALPSLLATVALLTVGSGAAPLAQADQAVIVQGSVRDQYGKTPNGPAVPPKYVDSVPNVTATRYVPPMSADDDHVVQQAAIDAQGHYSLRLTPGVWELQVHNVYDVAQPQIPTVDTRDTNGPIVQDLQIGQIDATLTGSVTGDGLDPQHPAHVALELMSDTPYSSRGGAGKWLTSSAYSMRLAPGSWSRGDAMQTNDGGYEKRLDARVPFVVPPGSSSADWQLPSFSFEDAVCELPHTCSLTAHGSGWLPDPPVEIYLVSQVEFPNGRPSGWMEGIPAIDSPQAADRRADSLVVEVQPDAAGRFDGPLSGQAQITVASIGSQQMFTFAAVQRGLGVFKMAQPTTGFSPPAFDPLVLLRTPTSGVPSVPDDVSFDAPAGDSGSQP